jgi:DNA-binding transcriptional regulator YiaG
MANQGEMVLTSESQIESQQNTSPISRGKRLKSLRRMTGFSRRAFAEKHEISPNTLQNWEDGKAGGLTEKGAKRVILALREEGIQVSKRWLLEGEGIKPYISDAVYTSNDLESYGEDKALPQTKEEIAIIAEVQALHSLYPNLIDFVIKDDAMHPYYQTGDWVAGVKRFNEDIASVCGKTCIVGTVNGDIYLRHLQPSNITGHYNLLCTNINATASEPVFNNIELEFAAPVIWHRREDD